MLNSRPNEVLVGETLQTRLAASPMFVCRFSGRAAPSRLVTEVTMYTVEPTTASDEALSGIVPTVEILDEEP